MWDFAVESLNQAGFPDVFVEWGGEIRATGQHPDGRPWNIFISRLGDLDPRHAIAFVSLNNEAIASSGDYLQNWTVRTGGLCSSQNTYCHIMDPWTFQPLKIEKNTIASASVSAPTCAFADGLATAAMLFSSIEEAKAWSEKIREKHPEVAFWFAVREENPASIPAR